MDQPHPVSTWNPVSPEWAGILQCPAGRRAMHERHREAEPDERKQARCERLQVMEAAPSKRGARPHGADRSPGEVLVVAGSPLASFTRAEIYDPSTGLWRFTG